MSSQMIFFEVRGCFELNGAGLCDMPRLNQSRKTDLPRACFLCPAPRQLGDHACDPALPRAQQQSGRPGGLFRDPSGRHDQHGRHCLVRGSGRALYRPGQQPEHELQSDHHYKVSAESRSRYSCEYIEFC